VNDALVLAFERAAGRAPGIEPVATPPSSAAAFDGFARRVVDAGRRVHAVPPCPASVMQRGLAVFEAPSSRGVATAVWRLVFDSWHDAAPALRGGARSRFLRFGGRGGQLDLEIVAAEAVDVRLRGTVDGPAGPLVLEIAPKSGARVRVPVRAGGAFAATLPGDCGPFTVAVRAGRRTLSRTGRIPPLGGR